MSNGKEHARIEYIDMARAIAMIFVVLGHINYANAGIKAWLYSFHMPAFFVISGLVLKIKADYSARDFWIDAKKSFIRLMVPYYIWALIFADFSAKNTLKIIYGSYQTIGWAGTLSSLWFLSVLWGSMLMVRALSFALNDRKNRIVRIIIAVALMLIGFIMPRIHFGYPLGVNVAFVASGFLIAGNIIAPVVYRISELFYGLNSAFKRIMAAIASLAITFFGTLLYRFNLPEDGNVLMGSANYGNPLFFVVVALLGCAMTLLLGIIFAGVRCNALKKSLSFIGRNSIAILMIHKTVIAALEKVFEHYPLPQPAELISSCVLSIVVCCFMALAINLFAPALVGKKDGLLK